MDTSERSGAWPRSVLETIDYRQEVALRKAADLLGLPGPDAAFEALSERKKKGVSPEQFRALRGWQDHLKGEAWERTKRDLRAHMATPLAASSPRFEDVVARDRWLRVREKIIRKRRAVGVASADPVPYVATLPSGDLNAVVTRCLDGEHEILFFERGLSRYLTDFALVVSWIMPPFPTDARWNDAALATIRPRYTMPPQSSRYLLATLGGYLGDGMPGRHAPKIALPRHNAHLFVDVLLGMFEFVFLHEQAHVTLGHVAERRRGHDVEFEADRHAVAVMSRLERRRDFSSPFAFWTADLLLRAFTIFDTALGILAFGAATKYWISKTHPDPYERRRVLAKALPQNGGLRTAAARNLMDMNDAVFGRMDEIVLPMVLTLRQSGMQPSPLWRGRIARSLEPEEAPPSVKTRDGASDGRL